jgi:hypothetical protein
MSNNPWADYGLAGIVIGALFSIIVLFIKTTNKQQKHNTEFVERILDENRKERSEMTQRWVKSSDKLSDAVEALAREVSREVTSR